jgi:hypothetical protein
LHVALAAVNADACNRRKRADERTRTAFLLITS